MMFPSFIFCVLFYHVFEINAGHPRHRFGGWDSLGNQLRYTDNENNFKTDHIWRDIFSRMSNQQLLQILQRHATKSELNQALEHLHNINSHIKNKYNSNIRDFYLPKSYQKPHRYSGYLHRDQPTYIQTVNNNAKLYKRPNKGHHYSYFPDDPEFAHPDSQSSEAMGSLLSDLDKLIKHNKKKENVEAPKLKVSRRSDVSNSGNTDSEDGPTNSLFLILNEKLISNSDGPIITVDPSSLSNNATVVTLGKISPDMTEEQVEKVVKKVSKELRKSEYKDMLETLASGDIPEEGKKLFQQIIQVNSQTRRYTKPHRCNMQSKLGKTFGGPRWFVCTGYVGLNSPSIYDK